MAVESRLMMLAMIIVMMATLKPLDVCRIQAAAFEQLIEVRHQTKLGLRYALSRRKHFVCELDVRPVQLMLPYEGAAANRK